MKWGCNINLLAKGAVDKEENVEEQSRHEGDERDPDRDRHLGSERRDEPASLVRPRHLQPVRDVEHVGVNPGEDLVEGDHDDDGQWKAEVAKEPPDLQKGIGLILWIKYLAFPVFSYFNFISQSFDYYRYG